MFKIKKTKTLENQLYFFQIVGIVLAIVVSMGVALYYSISSKQDSMDISIGNVAAIIADSPETIRILEEKQVSDSYNKYLDSLLEQIRYVDVITVCDTNSIRYYHNDKSRIGKKFIGGDEAEILSGSNPYVIYGSGSLGPQRRAFYPVNDENGKLLGFVMVAVLTTSISSLRGQIILTYLLIGIVLLILGILFSQILNRRLKKILMGYDPEQFKRMYVERTEVLDALEEGIFAINTKGEIILMNESALRMLELTEMPPAGTLLVDVYPETMLPSVIETGVAEYNISFVMMNKNILSNRIPIYENDKIFGAVSIFRNKTEVTKMAEELTGAKYMLDTLRAFNHEFKNKLHVILGYIEMGKPDEAASLIKNTSMVSTRAVSSITRQIQIPNLAALLIGKIIRSSELGIILTLKQGSYCSEESNFLPTDIYITILGNLIDNALEELNRSAAGRSKEIEVGINIWENGCILSVDDTGNGIADDLKNPIFQQGFSTKGEGRGTGLFLVKDLVERYGGELTLESEVGEGTSITITITKED